MSKLKPEPATNTRATGPRRSNRREIQYIYHWDRIIGALTVVAILIGLAAYGIHAMFFSADHQSVEATETIAIQTRKNEPLIPAEANDRPEPEVVTAETAEPQMPPAMDEAPATSPPEEDEPFLAAAETLPLTSNSTLDDQSLEPSTEPQNQQLSGSPREEIDEPGGFQSQPDKAPFALLDTQLSSAAVQRFGLAKSVVNREPRGDIHAVRPDSRGVASVFAFSDVVGMRGKSVHYRWLLNEKQVAEVRVGIGGDRWRSHSSKVINEHMKGTWRVELRDPQGQVLASASFTY